MNKQHMKQVKNKPHKKGKKNTKMNERDGMYKKNTAVNLGSSKVTWLKYVDGTDQRTATGVNWAVWRLKLTDVYDPDPLLLTGGITGYNEFSAFFNRWRVLANQITLTVTNREVFPLHFGILLAPSDITSLLSSRALALDALERPGCIFHKELSAQGGMDRTSFSRRIELKHILGDASTLRAGDFDGSVSTSPIRNLYVHFILVAPTTITTIANGVFYDLTISYLTKFYDILPKLLGMTEEQKLVLRLNQIAAAKSRVAIGRAYSQ